MELRQLRYFVAVTEEGGFGRAAERLHTVQSAVSRQIGLLERELGLVLFTRTTRRVGLTGAGERLLPEARAVLAAAARTREVAAEVAAGATGVLRLGTVHGPGDRVYRLLEELADRAPGLRVRPVRLPVTERLAAVRSGELDAALVRARPDAPGLELLPLWRDRLYAALPGGHPLAAAEELGPEQLAHLPLRLAAREDNPPFHDLVAPLAAAPAGPPFTDLLATLTSIGESPLAPSWTVFYEVGPLPRLPRTAIRPLTRPALTTYLAVLPGPPGPALRQLLAAAAAPAPAPAPAPGPGPAGPHG
ncbi:LysR family transcriptional regulator [Streptomyces sp. NPDC059355]|uniref:LysR family transcriptional regulator n=1 Tax=Streptomyces sp. NPDC059355 TaxID=3346811 RepID=UPI0036A91ABD